MAQIGLAMEHDGWVGALFSRDEGRILSWSGDGTLRLWDAATGAQIGPAREHDARGERRAVQPGRSRHPVVVHRSDAAAMGRGDRAQIGRR